METQSLSGVVALDLPNKDQRIAKKINLAKKMLIATAGAQIAAAGVGLMNLIQANQEIKAMGQQIPGYVYDRDLFSLSHAFSFWGAIIVVVSILILKELKEPKGIAWVGAIGVFIMAMGTWGVPFAIIGLLALLDREVRERYLKELDISL